MGVQLSQAATGAPLPEQQLDESLDFTLQVEPGGSPGLHLLPLQAQSDDERGIPGSGLEYGDVGSGGAGYAVAGAAPEGAEEGDLLVEVDGLPVAAVGLTKWIELASAGRPGYSGAVLFPLVEARDTAAGGQEEGNSGTPTQGGVPQQPADGPTGGAGHPVTGFVRVEVVGGTGVPASAKFRPVGERREALAQARARERADELETQRRLAAEAAAEREEAQQAEQEAKEKAAAETRAREAEEERQRREAEEAELAEKEKEDSERREKEAAALAAEQAKQDTAKLRKAGTEFVYTTEYKEVGPMGLTFDLDKDSAVVGAVEAGGVAHSAGVTTGDHLVSVNGKDTSNMAPAKAIKVLQKATWPRKLAFRVPERQAGVEEEVPLALVVQAPEVVRGEYLLRAAREWGGNHSDSSCEAYPLSLTVPAPACDQDLRLAGVQAEAGRPAIVLVRRGLCTFVEKAKNVQPRLVEATGGAVLGGKGGLVILNTDDAVADMPAGNLVTEDVNVTVTMIALSNGSSLEMLLTWGADVSATIAPANACPLPPRPRPETGGDGKPARDRAATDAGGRLLLHTPSGERDFDFHLAQYGPAAPNRTVSVFVADPFDGCDDKAYKVRTAGGFLVMQRGLCSFTMKTLAAQRAGATGVIIVNTAESTMRVMGDPQEADKVTIPTVMVSAQAGELLANAFQPERKPLMGRFFSEDFYGSYG